MIYIILAVALVAIAAYYPIKLTEFYCMESEEQSAKTQIISDLRAGAINRPLIKVVLGEGGYRLVRREADHIWEWMMRNTDEWRVAVTSKDEMVVVFRTSPFHPENWDDIDTYKNVMRQMFGEHGTKDFGECRASILEASRIRQNLKDLRKTEEHTQVSEYEYVYMMFGDEKVLAMVVDVNDVNDRLVAILSGSGKGRRYWAANNREMEVVPNDVAISELVRLKEERKNKKREEAIAKRREELCVKYGNIRPGTYLRAQNSLYIVDSVDLEDGTAKCVRLVDLGINFPANEKCILHLANGFRIATPEEVAKILVKEYCNE